jgi:GBP family porin
MKKKAIAGITVALLAGAAHADDGSSVTLYGILDVAVGTIDHSGSASSSFTSSVNPVSHVGVGTTNRVTGMFNGGISDSRWGIRGNEDIGGGWSAFFDLESGFNEPTGQLNNGAASIAGSKTTMAGATALNGQLFNRGAYVGLRNDQYGSLALGRTPTLGLDTIVNYDPIFAAQLFSPLGFSGSYAAGGITEGSRTDNNIKYTNKIGNVNVGLSYSLGGQAGSFAAGQTYGADIGYEAHNFGVQAVYYNARDAVHSTALLGTGGPGVGNLTLANDEGFILAAKYAIGGLTLKGGFEHYELSRPSDPSVYNTSTNGYNYYGYAGTLIPMAYAQVSNVYFFGGDYKVTPALDIAAGVYDTQTIANASAPTSGVNDVEYSVLVDYHLSRRTDVYAGYMFSKFNGVDTNLYLTTNYVAAGGIRTLF